MFVENMSWINPGYETLNLIMKYVKFQANNAFKNGTFFKIGKDLFFV